MAKRKNRFPRDHRLLVEFLNFDFGGKAVQSIPFKRFLAHYELDTETAGQIQAELRGVLFLKALDGKREVGPLVAKAQEYPIKTIPLPLEDNRGIETITVAPMDAREHLYGIIIVAISDRTFWSLQEECKNCHRRYWRKSDYCSLECGRDFNDKDAKNRMRRFRKNLKQRRKKGGNK